jgi:hypothetical protein
MMEVNWPPKPDKLVSSIEKRSMINGKNELSSW